MSHGSHDNKGNGDKGNQSSHHDDNKYDRNDLHEPYDWMTYTHEELYKMVHTGVNLDGAQAAATNWQKIGDDIAGVRSNLLKAVEDSTVGWDSESARLARNGLTEVTNWVDDTASYAHKVSAAITTETNNVEAARTAMPPPPQAPDAPVPAETPLPRTVLRPQDRLSMVDDAGTFGLAGIRQEPRLVQTSPNEFGGFETIGTSPVETLAANDASHRRAADVMAAFQRNSAAVDQTVPSQFTPPVNPVNPTPIGTDIGSRPPTTAPDTTNAGGGAGAPVGTGATGQNCGTTNASSRGGSGFGGGRGGGGGLGGGMGMARPFTSNSGNQGGGGGAGGGAGSAGGAAGVNEVSRGGAGAAAAAASSATGGQTKAFQNPLAMGGAPMAGAPAAGQGNNDEREHKSASYLEEDDNVFGLDRKAAPPVIGQ
ncbi:PPE domain-containing protein [Lentzea sp. BCCO 10_0856]|uniref:PPE domain-containing protein n=1 Tax=Lentzea miocenica TaxID=3095431 RepID=A0ABU4T295_9PSEU|nr:PPE domain-containing protein [Lentzea sp. BCCO 10_0856]MDX8032287.1 PPE domain-containing protein [Lentzea sp. BCCO 10_0856]